MPETTTPEERRDAMFARFRQEHPTRAETLGHEMDAIARGEFVPIQFDLDPICAYYVAGAIDLALTHPQHTPGPKVLLETVYERLARAIQEQYPELARQLAEGYRQRHANDGV